jgi:protein phosphatase 1 regulatory subunit 3A/B/C/D/E
LDTGNVSLENVIVKSPDRRIVGTVKVRNLSYDKLVFVRSTEDGWATHQDTECSYVCNNAMSNSTTAPVNGTGNGPVPSGSMPLQNGVTAIYDTFSFRLHLPTDATSMEFAVCYKGGEFECWDNNAGNNYCLSVGCPPSAVSLPMPSALSSQTSVPQTPEFDHQKLLPSSMHFFGVQSRQNSWVSGRDQKNDTSAYW